MASRGRVMAGCCRHGHALATATGWSPPTASAIRAAVEIASHLSLPPGLCRALRLCPILQLPETTALNQDVEHANVPSDKTRTRQSLADARRGRLPPFCGVADLRAHGVDRGQRRLTNGALLVRFEHPADQRHDRNVPADEPLPLVAVAEARIRPRPGARLTNNPRRPTMTHTIVSR